MKRKARKEEKKEDLKMIRKKREGVPRRTGWEVFCFLLADSMIKVREKRRK